MIIFGVIDVEWKRLEMEGMGKFVVYRWKWNLRNKLNKACKSHKVSISRQ
jgi:hypothetical protein